MSESTPLHVEITDVHDERLAIGGPLHGQRVESKAFGLKVSFPQPDGAVTYWRKRRAPDMTPFYMFDGLSDDEALRLMREVDGR